MGGLRFLQCSWSIVFIIWCFSVPLIRIHCFDDASTPSVNFFTTPTINDLNLKTSGHILIHLITRTEICRCWRCCRSCCCRCWSHCGFGLRLRYALSDSCIIPCGADRLQIKEKNKVGFCYAALNVESSCLVLRSIFFLIYFNRKVAGLYINENLMLWLSHY